MLVDVIKRDVEKIDSFLPVTEALTARDLDDKVYDELWYRLKSGDPEKVDIGEKLRGDSFTITGLPNLLQKCSIPPRRSGALLPFAAIANTRMTMQASSTREQSFKILSTTRISALHSWHSFTEPSTTFLPPTRSEDTALETLERGEKRPLPF